MTVLYDSIGDIDIRLIRQSNIKACISGEKVELYEYEKPYFYNFSPRQSHNDSISKRNSVRRADSLSRSRRFIRRIIYANESCWNVELNFFTFTFKKNVKDIREAFSEWSMFTKRLNRGLQSRGFSSSKYIGVVEFQKRGAIHFHVLYFNLPHLSSFKINVASIWGKGFIHSNPISQVGQIGAYVSKYLQKETIDKRLFGKKAYFCSRGLRRPYELRESSAIASFLSTMHNETTYEEVYETSKYGFIRYRQIQCQKSLQKSLSV